MKTPIMESHRIIFRPLRVQDAPVIFERWTSDDRVSRYVRWSTHQSVQDTIQWLQTEEENIMGEDFYQWGFVEKEKNFLFGSGGLHRNAEGIYELGYNIMYDYWNQGYTTEAAKRILKFALEELNQQEILAWYAKENPASGAILQKCGFLYEKDIVSRKFDGSEVYECRLCRLKLDNSIFH